MKTLKNNKWWSLILVPIFSTSLFVTILTAAPLTITEKMDTEEIQTIAVSTTEVPKNAAEQQPTSEPQSTVNTPNPNTPTSISSSTPAPTSTPVKTAQPQTSRSTSTSSTTSKTTAAKATTQPTKASAIISTGKQYLGVKYVYGGTTPAGFDCSGFVQYVFAKHGITLPRVSRDQYKIGTSVSYSNLQPGDLVFFSLAKNGVVDHEGIYIGNGQFINAASSKGVTIYTLGTYWQSAYVGAKRVL
ncbi:C40 family peptidase [Desulfosporosinus meridiei]|uniref:Cell wall-associated hydrolase, invasion-associated protein n=1 Tax=Desulfosporosinus meridiei (strain ATCC BAA-275 / DSM 13257 / KCTC 12902 / NCIMB 13706 / S10) TaxID=768704 RepID=J7IPF8_DESMD|nr:C40 family peptidase [Desulfosporosinus meridiei]AFQ43495.1 cell wall-associated hydrolase, invasion-associated protein [Desulfosporosinus meridiei DSM 13257]